MSGKLFSDRYGSNLPSATNERKEKLLRLEELFVELHDAD